MQIFDMKGKVTLVTGACGWLGEAFCRGLADAGSTVVCSSRSRSRAQALVDSLPSAAQQQHLAIELDHMEESSILSGFTEAVERAGKLDVLVNNGLEILGRDWTNVTLEEFAHHQRNNAGYFELARAIRQHLVSRQAAGSIINVGSMYGEVGSYPETYDNVSVASPVAYHTLKGGTLQMTRHLAVYWAKDQVRVNALSPGPFPNPDTAPPELVERLKAKSPMGRMGKPDELIGALIFLASDASLYVTGHNLVVDGGWTAW